MFRHISSTYYNSNTSATAFVFLNSEEEEFCSSHPSDPDLKFIESKPDSDLQAVKGKSKIRSHEIKREEKIDNLQQNVLVYVVSDTSTCNITHQMRVTGKYQYLPKPVKFGLLTSLIDMLGVKKSAAARPVSTNQIALGDNYEKDHPLGGLPIGDSKYVESVAIAYYMLSSRKLRVDGCKLSDIRIGGKRVITSDLLSLSDEDGPIDYLHIPLFNNDESLVIRITRCLNMHEACEKFGYVSEFIEEGADGIYHTDFSRTKLYAVNSFGQVDFHRNLADTCSDPLCGVSICHPPKSIIKNATPVEDVIPVDFKESFSKDEKLIVATSSSEPPKSQRLVRPRAASVIDEDTTQTFTVDQFRNLDHEAWAFFGLQMDIINKLPLSEASLSALMIRAAVLDLVD